MTSYLSVVSVSVPFKHLHLLARIVFLLEFLNPMLPSMPVSHMGNPQRWNFDLREKEGLGVGPQAH